MLNDKNELTIGGVLTLAFAGLMLLVTVIYLLNGLDRIVGREFAKFDEETRRQVQEESRAYQEGMAQNLNKLCLEWERSGNTAIARAIRHRSAGYSGELPDHVQQCVNQARNQK